jgi:mono/diheme cytochrome c family protein
LDYTVGSTDICEWMTANRRGNLVWVERHFRVQASAQPLVLVLGRKPPEGVAGRPLAVTVSNVGTDSAAQDQSDARTWTVRLAGHARPVEFVVTLTIGTGLPGPPRPFPTVASAPPPRRWPQELTTQGTLSAKKSAYVVDDIPLPLDNPWRRNIRVADIQFFSDGSAAAVTIDGDVWRIDGLQGALKSVRWRRFASGLHEPLGLAIRHDEIYVFDRTGIWRLRDTRGTGEADSYELFCNGFAQTAAVRDHACSIKLAPDGSFVIATGGSQDNTLGKDNGKVLRISADGKRVTTLGWGFRMPFIGVNPRTGEIAVSDQQGFYVPSTPVYLLGKNEYHGYLDDFQAPEKYPAPIADPLLWIPHPVNPSSASLTWLTGARMGPLNDALILVGYNRPELFRILVDTRHAQPQGAAVSLTSDFTFAPLNAAVDPADGQLYAAGFRIYGSTGPRISGLARVRYTGASSLLPREVVAMDQGILLRFEVSLDPAVARNPASYVVGRWNYVRSHHYGSGHYKLDGTPGQDRMAPSSAYLSTDGKSVFIGLPGMKSGVWQMHVGWSLATGDGVHFEDDAYFTPYALAPFTPPAEGFAAGAVDLTPRSIASPVSGAISAEEGQHLSGLLGCIACHTTNGTVGTAHLAPSWKGLFGTTVTLDDGTTCVADERYIREHILKRTDRHVRGFENSMPSYSGIATDAQIESLILYLKTLR